MVATLNTIFFLWFTIGLLLALFYVGRRIIDYVREGIYPPLLAYRDAGLLGGLAFPFLMILIFRMLDLTHAVTGTLWWTLLTALPAVLGVTHFIYIERFVIERRESRGYKKVMLEVAARLAEQELAEDKEFGDKRRDLEKKHIREAAENATRTQE